jgi:DNA (cytosine-5)-methyltransferase 1
MGYIVFWRMVFAEHFGVAQLRPRFVLVALKEEFASYFSYPSGDPDDKAYVGDTLYDLMSSGGWEGADLWRETAMSIAPTLVGGSKKHGGADLGPTRARNKWLELGVNGKGVADDVPNDSHPVDHKPKLTIRMVARLQGFPDEWMFKGGKTSQYRQIGNAFPPPVARAFGKAIISALNKEECVFDGPVDHQISLVMRGIAA